LRRLAALALVTLAACDDSIPPPLIVEPAEDAVVDRALMRVRTSAPDDLYLAGFGTGEFSTSISRHVNWRVDGGEITEIQFPTIDHDDDAPFLFGAITPAGSAELQVGACDSFDECSWAPRHVTVALRPGSPDPAFAGCGQLVLPGYDRASYATPLADGRVLIGTEDLTVGVSLLALRADGTLDAGFGDHGVVQIAAATGPAYRVVPQLDGGLVVVLADRLARRDATGTLDPAFGADGIASVVPPVGAVVSLTAAAPDRDGGGYTLAGITQLDPADYQNVETFVAHLDATGAQLGYVVLDAAGGPWRATDVDPDGNVVSTGPDRLRLDTLAGPVTGFGAAGGLQLPAGTGMTDAIFAGDGLAIAQRVFVGELPQQRVTPVSRAGALGPAVDLPFDASWVDPILAPAPDGSLYAGGAIPHPMEPASLVRDDIDGHDFAVVHLVDGAIDAGFGDAGVAHASFMLARSPIVLETIDDHPIALTNGADGAPWMTGLSIGIVTDERAWLRAVRTQVVVARFLP
jgi:hypothetical protein